MNLIGIKHRVFRNFPSEPGSVPFKSAYSVYYWTQEADMLVNRALANCTFNAAPHLHIRGNVMVLKHRQSSEAKFEDMTAEDQALICAVLDTYVPTHCLTSLHVDERIVLLHTSARWLTVCLTMWLSTNSIFWRLRTEWLSNVS